MWGAKFGTSNEISQGKHMDIVKNLARLITNVAIKENQTLSLIPKLGIFHMPELAFAYECGKAAMLDSENVFGNDIPTWVREKDLGNGGPTDLLFEFDNGKRIAIEFKIRDTVSSYKKDIEKLSKLPDVDTIKIFCALIDVFDKKLPDDGRQAELEKASGNEVHVVSKTIISTSQDWYKSPTSCVVCIWSIGNSRF